MPTVNLRQLRNTRQLKSWLQAGKTVDLLERSRVIGHIVPEGQPRSVEWPDFEARMKKLFGHKIFPAVEIVIEERGRY